MSAKAWTEAGVAFLLFLGLALGPPLPPGGALTLLFLLFTYYFALGRLLPQLDDAFILRAFRYIPKDGVPKRRDKGRCIVLALLAVELVLLGLLRRYGLLDGQGALAWVFALLTLNVFFMHRACPLRLLLFPSVACCKECAIAGWDHALLFSPLLFATGLSPAVTLVAWILVFLSFSDMVAWELARRFAPQRLAPETNAYLSCARCRRKRCARRS